jgi:COMPASS component SWD3
MSTNTSPGPPSRGSPKRKRSQSPDDAHFQYAYDEDLGSDAEETFRTPDDEPDGATPKKRRIERPKRLNYVPYMTLRGHKRGVSSVKFSPDGKWIASCCKNTNARVIEAL